MNSKVIQNQTLSNAVNCHSIIAKTNAKGVITFVNDKFCQISGYRKEELIGNTHSMINSGYHEPEFFQNMWKTIKSGNVWQGDLCNKSKYGSLYWVNTTIIPEIGENGNIQGYLSIRTEITKTKMDSALLEAEQEAMRSIMVGDGLDKAMLNVLKKLNQFDINHKLSILEKTSNNELIHLAQIGLPDFYIQAINGVKIKDHSGSCSTCAFRKEEVYIDDITRHSYWAPFRVLASSADLVACWSNPILDHDNNLFGTLAFYPIAKRKPTEIEKHLMLKTSEVLAVLFTIYRERNSYFEQNMKLDNIIQTSPLSICELSLDGKIRSINKSGVEMFTLKNESGLIGTYFPDFPKSKKDKNEMKQHFLDAVVGIKSNFEFRIDLLNQEKCFLNYLLPLKDKKGDVYRVLSISKDITIRRQQQISLSEKAQIAEEANNMKSNFLAAMSHELRTPLNAILGFGESLKLKYYGEHLSGKNEEYVDYIIESGKNMLHLVDEILDLTRIENENIDLKEEEFNVNLFFSQLTNELLSLAQSKSSHLIFQSTGNDFTLKGDKKIIGTIFKNIVSNAINHSPEKSNIEIYFGQDAQGGISINISDEGPGFNENSIKNLEQPFRFDDAYKTSKTKGVGLGLYLTKRYADLHSANINIKNRNGNGANVSINFPPERFYENAS